MPFFCSAVEFERSYKRFKPLVTSSNILDFKFTPLNGSTSCAVNRQASKDWLHRPVENFSFILYNSFYLTNVYGGNLLYVSRLNAWLWGLESISLTAIHQYVTYAAVNPTYNQRNNG